MAKTELVDLEYRRIVHETPAAYLIDFDRGKEAIWLPKSQCEVDEDRNTVTCSHRLAEDKEIEDYAV
jgi:hypothetical protein